MDKAYMVQHHLRGQSQGLAWLLLRADNKRCIFLKSQRLDRLSVNWFQTLFIKCIIKHGVTFDQDKIVKNNWFYYGEDIQTIDSSPIVCLGTTYIFLKE